MNRGVHFAIAIFASFIFSAFWGVIWGAILGMLLFAVLRIPSYGKLSTNISREATNVAVDQIHQEQQKAFRTLRQSGVDLDNLVVTIGKDVRWDDVNRQIFRVLEFDPGTTVMTEDDEVISQSRIKPYGTLLVESPIFNFKAHLPIVHRDDFGLAFIAFEDPETVSRFNSDHELLVCYAPRKRLPYGAIGVSHGLHFVMTKRGSLEKYYEIGEGTLMDDPDPERLFGPFKWDGSLSVSVNNNPNV